MFAGICSAKKPTLKIDTVKLDHLDGIGQYLE